MTKRLKITIEDGNKKAKIYYDSEWQEYVVQFYIDGRWEAKADYFTPDLEDAKDTVNLVYRRDRVRALAEKLPKAIDPVNGKEVFPKYIIDSQARLVIDLEDGNGFYFADYYGEFRGELPWICEALEQFAKEHKGYWEWNNPGSICFVENTL